MSAAPQKSSSNRSAFLIGSEALPFSKTGGLADVLGALPSALARLGWQVTVVTPRYRGVTAGTLVERMPVTVGAQSFNVGYFDAPLPDGARALLIDVPELYDREHLYNVGNVDYADNPRRFALLARAALEWIARRGERVDVVHAHDWQAGLVPVYLESYYGVTTRCVERPRFSRSTTSPIRACSRLTGCLASICRGTSLPWIGWNIGDVSASSRGASTPPRC